MSELFNRKQMDFKVIIEPRDLGDLGGVIVSTAWMSDDPAKDYERRCNEIVQDVKRHVENVGSVYIDSTIFEVCPHCGTVIDPDDLLPICCAALQDDDRYKVIMAQRLTEEIEHLERRLDKARQYLDYVTTEAQS